MLAAQQSFEFPEHASYHDQSEWGFFSILTRPAGARAKQRSYRLHMLPKVIGLVDPCSDSWISQAEFIEPNRRVVNLLRLNLLFVDIDCHKLPWTGGKNADQMCSGLLHFCQTEGIPEPSLVVFSGRGLQAKWLLERSLPRQALPRWNACQKALVESLSPLGSDPQAKDASRVLRLVNTVNTKSGEICRVVHVAGSIDVPKRYGFEFLAEHLLPLSRDQLQSKRQAPTLRVVDGSKRSNQSKFSKFSLNWHRLEDLRKLAEIRGGVAEGQRMTHLFWQLNFLLLSGATHAQQMWHEAAALAYKIDSNWTYGEDTLSTLYAKAQAHNAGETVEFAGRKWSPLYTPKNETLIDIFGISDAEQQHLKTIISSDLARQRDAKRDTVRRRAAGAVPRSQYESGSISKIKPWEAEGISRATWYRRRETSPSV